MPAPVFFSSIKQHRRFLTGILIALAFTRLFLDFSPLFLPDWALWLSPAIFLSGYFAGRRWPSPRWSAWGLLIYLIRPAPLPEMAIFAIALALSGVLMGQKTFGKNDHLWAGVVAGSLMFVIYLVTLSPGILAADAGEFQVVAAKWGVAHAPGYPLYTLLAGIIAHLLPVGTMAWRVNLFSALTGAITIAVLTGSISRETKNPVVGIITGLILGTSLTFWMTATQASIRPLMGLFIVLMLEATLAYHRASLEKKPISPALMRFGLAAGLGVTHHGSLFFVGLTLALAIALANIYAWEKWPLAMGTALMGMLPWLYLLIRADGFLAPVDLDTWDGFWYHVLARGFAGDMFAYLHPEHWGARLQVMQAVFALQWQGWIIPLALLGLLAGFRRDLWLSGTCLSAWLVHSFIVGTYRAPQTVEYALPAYPFIALAVGWLMGTQSGSRQILALAVAIASLFMSFESGWITMSRLAAQEEARTSAEDILQNAPPDALILANWHRTPPLWYLQQVENMRPDVDIRYVSPAGEETPMQTWLRQIQEAIRSGREVMVTQQFPEFYRYLPYTLENNHIHNHPEQTRPSDLRAETDLIGLSADWQFPEHPIRNGEYARSYFTWQVKQPVHFGEITTFIHIGLPDTPPQAQLDLPLQMPDNTGTLALAYDVFIPVTVPPGEWEVRVGAYTSENESLLTENGQPGIRVGTVHIHPGQFPMPTRHPVYIDMGNAHLRGFDYDTTYPGETRLYLHWQLEKPESNYPIEIVDTAGGIWSPETAFLQQPTGYWTGSHTIPATIAEQGIRVRLDKHEFLLPAPRTNDHYIIMDNMGALIDWQATCQNRQLQTTIQFLTVGAAFEDIQMHFEIKEDNGYRYAEDFTPVQGSIPAFKWGYGHLITSRQSLSAVFENCPRHIYFSFYNGLTGRILSVSESRLLESGLPLQP